MNSLSLVMFIPLVKLALEDFRRREVPLVWLVVLAVCSAGVGITTVDTARPAAGIGAAVDAAAWRGMFARSGLNLLLILYMGVGVTVWAWVKSRRPVNPVNRFIGLGDVLFFVVLTPLFPLREFVCLLVSCMVFSLVWWRVRLTTSAAERTASESPKTIPLVATSAIVTGVTVIYDTFLRQL